MEDLLGVDLQFLEMSAKILQFIDPSLERTSLVDILGTLKLTFAFLYARFWPVSLSELSLSACDVAVATPAIVHLQATSASA